MRLYSRWHSCNWHFWVSVRARGHGGVDLAELVAPNLTTRASPERVRWEDTPARHLQNLTTSDLQVAGNFVCVYKWLHAALAIFTERSKLPPATRHICQALTPLLRTVAVKVPRRLLVQLVWTAPRCLLADTTDALGCYRRHARARVRLKTYDLSVASARSVMPMNPRVFAHAGPRSQSSFRIVSLQMPISRAVEAVALAERLRAQVARVRGRNLRPLRHSVL